jgi:radical S-adenosyl methionine domain-containing protein 2
VTPFLISKDQFDKFLKRHVRQKCLVPESNEMMQTSYLMLDENLCFLDCSGGGKVPSPSILQVGVEKALEKAGFDKNMFLKRGGVYNWKTDCSPSNLPEW